MVSTRHHPRPFPPPEAATSPTRSPQTPTSATSSSKAGPGSPPPTTATKRPSRATSRKRNSIGKEAPTESPSKPAALEKALSLSSTSTTTTRSQQRSESRPSRAVTRSRTKAQEKHVYTHTPPPLLIPWMIISLPLVIWDTGYVLGRPHTMPGGRFHSPLWTPYALYGTIDYMYGWPAIEARIGFTAAQGSLNLIETTVYIIYLVILARCFTGHEGFLRGVAVRSVTDLFTRYDEHGAGKLVFHGGRELAFAVLLCFSSAVMTLSKTVLYGLNEVFSGFASIGHNNPASLFWLWIVPNGAWIVLPTYLVWMLGKDIIEELVGEKTLDGHKVE